MHLLRVLLWWHWPMATSVMVGSGEVIDDGPKIDPNCKRPQPCSTLNFYDEKGPFRTGPWDSIKLWGCRRWTPWGSMVATRATCVEIFSSNARVEIFFSHARVEIFLQILFQRRKRSNHEDEPTNDGAWNQEGACVCTLSYVQQSNICLYRVDLPLRHVDNRWAFRGCWSLVMSRKRTPLTNLKKHISESDKGGCCWYFLQSRSRLPDIS